MLSVRLLIGGLFLYAGWIKMVGPGPFADSIVSCKLLPAAAVNLLAMALPPFEMLLALLLIAGWRARAAALGTMLLSTVFAVALGQALARGLLVDCGCFGGGQPSTLKTWASLGRDLLILAGACMLWRAAPREQKAPNAQASAPAAMG